MATKESNWIAYMKKLGNFSHLNHVNKLVVYILWLYCWNSVYLMFMDWSCCCLVLSGIFLKKSPINLHWRPWDLHSGIFWTRKQLHSTSNHPRNQLKSPRGLYTRQHELVNGPETVYIFGCPLPHSLILCEKIYKSSYKCSGMRLFFAWQGRQVFYQYWGSVGSFCGFGWWQALSSSPVWNMENSTSCVQWCVRSSSHVSQHPVWGNNSCWIQQMLHCCTSSHYLAKADRFDAQQ